MRALYYTGTMQMEMQCTVQGSGAATIIGNGTYTPNGFQMENLMRMNANGMTMEIKTVVNATREGSC